MEHPFDTLLEKAKIAHSNWVKGAPMPSGFSADMEKLGDSLRAACAVGYMQAQKDLALTWEDVAKIITVYEAGIENGDYRRYNEAEWMKEYSQDILKRFNEQKKK